MQNVDTFDTSGHDFKQGQMQWLVIKAHDGLFANRKITCTVYGCACAHADRLTSHIHLPTGLMKCLKGVTLAPIAPDRQTFLKAQSHFGGNSRAVNPPFNPTPTFHLNDLRVHASSICHCVSVNMHSPYLSTNTWGKYPAVCGSIRFLLAGC